MAQSSNRNHQVKPTSRVRNDAEQRPVQPVERRRQQRGTIGFTLTERDTWDRREPPRDAHFFVHALQLPTDSISYWMSQRLQELFPEKSILETVDDTFDIKDFSDAGGCSLLQKGAPYGEWLTRWRGPARQAETWPQEVWFAAEWENRRFDVIVAYFDCYRHHFVIGSSREDLEALFARVCEWNSELRGRVLMFERGRWRKSGQLFREIQSTTLEALVLPPGLKRELVDDVKRFFETERTYERYRVPWKRGILLTGPPGNGKTLAVKALVSATGRRCLYVKSFRSKNGPDEYSIADVFGTARRRSPCILVFEDLDSLITSRNRSFFLNELDGLRANAGILTIATSNHPERLDPAIADRPSRFDRKYDFGLPEVPQRLEYIARWNKSLDAQVRLSECAAEKLARNTDAFSFAYLKELFLSSMLRWVSDGAAGDLEPVMLAQIDALRHQMRGTPIAPDQEAGETDEGEEDDDDEDNRDDEDLD